LVHEPAGSQGGAEFADESLRRIGGGGPGSPTEKNTSRTRRCGSGEKEEPTRQRLGKLLAPSGSLAPNAIFKGSQTENHGGSPLAPWWGKG